MCLGIPGEVVELDGDHPDLAVVDVQGTRRPINIGMLADEPVGLGDWILIHMGFAMERMTREEAASALAFLEGQATQDEALALQLPDGGWDGQPA